MHAHPATAAFTGAKCVRLQLQEDSAEARGACGATDRDGDQGRWRSELRTDERDERHALGGSIHCHTSKRPEAISHVGWPSASCKVTD